MADAAPVATRPVAHLEVIEQAGSLVFVKGWLRLDPALLAAGPPLLHLEPAGLPPVARRLGRLHDRADLPARDGLAAGKGFQLLLPAGAPWAEASARLEIGGCDLPLGPGRLRPVPFRPRGALAPPNRWGVPGWVVDLPGRPPVLLVDERYPVPLALEHHRPDLPFDDGSDPPRFGFRIPLATLAAALRGFHPGATLLDGEPHDLTLLAGGVELGHQMLRVARRMGGRLERLRDGEAVGWATEADGGDEEPTVDLLLDGTRWQSVPAAMPRADLAANGVGSRLRGGAFRVELPLRNPGATPSPALVARIGHAREELAGATVLAELPPWRPDLARVLATLPAAPLPVAVVVPIHNAAADLARCIDAVVRHSTGPARLILIDDASTDPAVAEVLARWEGTPGIEVHRNPQNLGFTATVNRGMALAGRDDVVLLNSDTMVGPGWLDGLRSAAWSDPRIGTVTPLSNNAGAFSAPEFDAGNRLPEWFAPADMARLARQAALGLLPAVPTGNGFCLFIRRDCLDAVGPFDEAAFPRGYGEENDFCLRAQRAGFEHLVDDRIWVWHRRSASFGEAREAQLQAGRAVLDARYPEYGTLTGIYRDDAAFLAIRWRLRRALEAALAATATPRPRVLFVISTQSGGTPQTNRDLMQALADRYEPWLLRCDGRMLELTRHGDDAPLETVRLERAMLPGLHRSAEYDRHLADLLLRHGIELVHVRHIAWHGLGLPEVCRRLGIPVVFSFHDFYTVCPTVKLLDAEGRFCAGRCTSGEGDCTAELWPAWVMPPLRGRFLPRWREMMAAALDACDAFVTTSPFARATLLDAFPALAGRDFRLLPHGRDFARLDSLAAEPVLDAPLRVLVPGNISAAKGAGLIAAMAALDTEREVEFHILGNVDATLQAPIPGVVLHGAYGRDEFGARVRDIQPHLAAVLSIWPETWCHTLTECWAAGLPVLATALGAPAERIGADGGGWLVEPGTSPAAILDRLRALKRDRAELRARRDQVLDWQHRIGRPYDTAGMAAGYDLLYRAVLERRRSFAAAAAPARLPVVLAVTRRAGPPLPLPLPIGNAVARQAVFRRVSPDHPFGDPAAGPGDVVLLGAGALRPRDIPALLARCQAAGLPLVVEAEEAMAALLAGPGPAAEPVRGLLEAAALVLAPTPAAARLLAAAGIAATRLPDLLDAAAWLAPLPPAAAPAVTPAEGAPCRLLLLAEPGGLAPLLEELRALEVAEPVLPGPLAPGEDALRAFRELARGCDLALLPPAGEGDPAAGGDPSAGSDPRALMAAAAGLPLLRAAGPGEAPGETAEGAILLPAHPLAWVRTIGELSVDPARRAALARRGRRHALARMAPGGNGAALDALLGGVAGSKGAP